MVEQSMKDLLSHVLGRGVLVRLYMHRHNI